MLPEKPRVISPELAFADHAMNIRILVDQEKAPGFIIGLSGYNSILSFLILARGLEDLGLQHRLIGTHYRDEKSPEELARVQTADPSCDGFASNVLPWLQKQAPQAQVFAATPLGGHQDPRRWADLSLRSLYHIEHDERGMLKTRSLPPGENYWVVSSRNATQDALGTYSQGSLMATVLPITDLWQSEVLQICAHLGVPDEVMANARLPDSPRGHTETAAQNIEALDAMLMSHKGHLDYSYMEKTYPPELLQVLSDHIAQRKKSRNQEKRPRRTVNVSPNPSFIKPRS